MHINRNASHVVRGFFLHSLSVIGVIAGTACPDPDAKLTDFIDSTKEQRQPQDATSTSSSTNTNNTDTKETEDVQVANISGTFFFALETAIAIPGSTFQFLAYSELTPNEAGGGSLSLRFQPLSLIQGSTSEPRDPLDQLLDYKDIAVTPEGKFELDMGNVTILGEANPISQSIIKANLVISGVIRSEDEWCGTITGMATEPLELNLDGTTFAAKRLTDTIPDSVPIDTLPVPKDQLPIPFEGFDPACP